VQDLSRPLPGISDNRSKLRIGFKVDFINSALVLSANSAAFCSASRRI